jgi:hypothetical protein
VKGSQLIVPSPTPTPPPETSSKPCRAVNLYRASSTSRTGRLNEAANKAA